MDNNGDGKTLAWTEEAKFQFLLRIVAQLKEDGKSINWQRLNMPGRTTKSLQNMWTKINKAVADLEETGGSNPSTVAKTPSKRGRPPKSAAKKENADDKEAVDGEDPPKPTAKKRAAAGGSGKKAKKIKKDSDSDEDEKTWAQPVKPKIEDEDDE